MTDVVVQRCVLRVVRHGGWSWGPAPERLVDAALAALPELIAAAVERVDPGGRAGLELSAPLSVRARMSLDELARGAALPLRDALAPAVERAVRGALPPGGTRPAPPGPEHGAGPAAADRNPPRVSAASARELLTGWLAGGLLDRLLALFGEPALGAWERSALHPRGHAPGDEARPDPEALRLVKDVLGSLPPPTSVSELLRARLSLAAAAAAPHGDWNAAVALVDAALPAPEQLGRKVAEPAPGRSPPALRAAGDVSGPARAESRPGPRPPSDPAARRAGDRRPSGAPVVVAALPFLVLVPLSRVGYLDALGVALDAADADAAAFATALALKLLDPPERGWRRSSGALAAARACAGREVEPVELTALAAAAPRFASALDALVATALMEGRGNRALVLDRAPGGELLLIDPTGWFVVAAGAAGHLGRVLQGGRCRSVRVTAAADGADLRTALEQAGVTCARDRRTGRTHELLGALGQRRAVPLAGDPALERSLTLAAALGLGSLAWELWGKERETDPLLALDRFGDLEARVSVSLESVGVKLPLGRRHRDLLDNGLLGTVEGVPWLGGRRVELGGG